MVDAEDGIARDGAGDLNVNFGGGGKEVVAPLVASAMGLDCDKSIVGIRAGVSAALTPWRGTARWILSM